MAKTYTTRTDREIIYELVQLVNCISLVYTLQVSVMICSSPTVPLVNQYFMTRTTRTGRA